MKLFITLLILLSIKFVNSQINYHFILYEFKYANEKDFIEIDNNNFLQFFTLPNNHNILQLNADVQLETFDINSYIYDYKYDLDTCNNIKISFKIKKNHRYNNKLNVIITKKNNEDYYLINIFRRFTDFDIYFKGYLTN